MRIYAGFCLVLSILVLSGCLSFGGSSTKGNVDYYEVPNPYVEKDDHVRTVAVYTPPGYKESDQLYPLMILLSHYASGDHSAFLGDGYPTVNVLIGEIDIKKLCDEMIADGRMNPAIIALPNYRHGFGENSKLYYDYISKTVLDSLRKEYRISGKREDVTLAGHFWSGRDVVEIAMANEELFGTVVAYSPCMSFAVPKIIERDYDASNPVEFLFYQTVFSINYGNGACADRLSRKYAETLRKFGIAVFEESYESDQFSTLPVQIEHSLEAIF